jgi:hypothetical protein
MATLFDTRDESSFFESAYRRKKEVDKVQKQLQGLSDWINFLSKQRSALKAFDSRLLTFVSF